MRDTSCASVFSTLHPQSFYYKDLGNKLIHSPSFYESAKTTSLFSTRFLQCFSIQKPLQGKCTKFCKNTASVWCTSMSYRAFLHDNFKFMIPFCLVWAKIVISQKSLNELSLSLNCNGSWLKALIHSKTNQLFFFLQTPHYIMVQFLENW